MKRGERRSIDQFGIDDLFLGRFADLTFPHLSQRIANIISDLGKFFVRFRENFFYCLFMTYHFEKRFEAMIDGLRG